MRISEIVLNKEQILKSDSVILTNVRPVFEYDENNNKTDKLKGFAYTVVCPDANYEKVTVKVEQAKATITQEELDSVKEAVMISFKGFEARFYKDFKTNDYRLSAKAEDIIM